jgi:hypothetical protein
MGSLVLFLSLSSLAAVVMSASAGITVAGGGRLGAGAMRVIGLAGGIASGGCGKIYAPPFFDLLPHSLVHIWPPPTGKSTVAKMLEKRGAAVVNADLLGHESYLPGKPAYGKILEVWLL